MRPSTDSPDSRPLRVAFLGIGAMGLPMATNLVRTGYPVTVWNRTITRTESVADLGASVASSAASAVSSADVVVLMLESGPVVEEVMFVQRVAESIRSGAAVIDMSSIPPDLASDHARRLEGMGVDYLDAPVSGGIIGAENGSLAILVGGNAKVVDRFWTLLQTLGNPTHLGPAGSGQAAKLANQIIVGVTIAAVAEALALGGALGLEPHTVISALSGGFADSRILREHGARIVNSDFRAGATVRIQTKDLLTALEAAQRVSLELPMSAMALKQYRVVEQRGLSGLDHSAVSLAYAPDRSAGD